MWTEKEEWVLYKHNMTFVSRTFDFVKSLKGTVLICDTFYLPSFLEVRMQVQLPYTGLELVVLQGLFQQCGKHLKFQFSLTCLDFWKLSLYRDLQSW